MCTCCLFHLFPIAENNCRWRLVWKTGWRITKTWCYNISCATRLITFSMTPQLYCKYNDHKMQFIITARVVYVWSTHIGSSVALSLLQQKYLAFTYSWFYSGNEHVCIPFNIKLTQNWWTMIQVNRSRNTISNSIILISWTANLNICF